MELSKIISAHTNSVIYLFHLLWRGHQVIVENRKVEICYNEAAHFGDWVFLCQGSKSIYTIVFDN